MVWYLYKYNALTGVKFPPGITVSATGVASILLRQGVAASVRPGERLAALAHRALALTGSLAIMALGIVLLLGALERVGIPL